MAAIVGRSVNSGDRAEFHSTDKFRFFFRVFRVFRVKTLLLIGFRTRPALS